MTYRQEMARLAGELGKLLIDGGRVPEYDLPDALAGHTAVVQLLRTVHREVLLPPHGPVPNLDYHLRNEPQLVELPGGFTVSEPAATEAGKRWHNVATWATSAEQHWQGATLSSRPSGDAAWSELADIGAVAEAIGMLDADIADSLAEAGRWPEAAAFRSDRAALLDTARRIQRMAASGPIPPAKDLVPAFTVTEVLTVSGPEALPAALDRLRELVLMETDLPPAQLDLITQVTAQTAAAASSAFWPPAGAVASALREHAQRLADSTGYTLWITPLRLGKGLAAAQAQHIHHALEGLRRRNVRLPHDVAYQAARAVVPITKVVTKKATQQVKSGTWLLRRAGASPRWNASQGPQDEPRLLTRLRHANAHGPTLTEVLDGVPPIAPGARPPAPAPREVLAKPLAVRNSLPPVVSLHPPPPKR